MPALPPTMWVLPDASAPLRHVTAAFAERHGPVEVRHSLQDDATGVGYGRTVSLPSRGRGYPMSIKVISPRLALDLVRHPAPVIIALELDLAVLYALLARCIRRGRRVVVLVEGDVAMLGPTGSAGWKMRFRRLLARGVDRFVANSDHAVRYLREGLGVPPDRITQGWWLAGLPADVPALPPPQGTRDVGGGPVFITVGQLIPRKGHDALIRAVARYRDDHGACRLWILGDGPDRGALRRLADDLGLGESVTLFGHVDAARLRGALEAADVFVFPTHSDLVGRALVEAVSLGLPTVVSHRSGAIGGLLVDGESCVVIDPDDPHDLVRGMALAGTDPMLTRLRTGAAQLAPLVSVHAAADVIAGAVAEARRA